MTLKEALANLQNNNVVVQSPLFTIKGTGKNIEKAIRSEYLDKELQGSRFINFHYCLFI